ncbi:MAG: zinc ribbon domain-containing protein [Coleofasciculus sp. F4-SAH-05]
MDMAPSWVSQTPYNPRQLAVFQAFEAHKAARKSGGDAQFRSVREPVKSIRFQKDNWKKGAFYPTQTKGLSFKASEPIIDKMQHEPALVLDRGRWFICYAIDAPKPEPLDSQLAIALDPGVRTFLTGFDGSEVWEVGKYDIGRIYRLASHLDRLMSRIGLSKGRQFKHLRYQEYTSKTCSKCGHVHTKLGGNKRFVCPSCGHTIGRDINGAFNILLKALRDTSTSGVIASFQIVPYSETSGAIPDFSGLNVSDNTCKG